MSGVIVTRPRDNTTDCSNFTRVTYTLASPRPALPPSLPPSPPPCRCMSRAFNFASKRCPVIDRHVTRLVPFFATHAAVLVHPYTSSPGPLYVSIIELLSRGQSVNRPGRNQSHRDRKEFGLSVIYRPRVSGPRVSRYCISLDINGYERAYRAPLSRGATHFIRYIRTSRLFGRYRSCLTVSHRNINLTRVALAAEKEFARDRSHRYIDFLSTYTRCVAFLADATQSTRANMDVIGWRSQAAPLLIARGSDACFSKFPGPPSSRSETREMKYTWRRRGLSLSP